jgi:hypothetical protein
MATLVLILKFWGGLLLLFALGWLMGWLFRLNNRFKI